MANEDKLPASRHQWERLMPTSLRSRFWLAIRIVLGALAAGAAIVTFGLAFGWRPVLLTFVIALALAVAFFSAYLHRRAWIVLGEELRRADEAEEVARQSLAQTRRIMSAYQEQMEVALKLTDSAIAQSKERQAHTERALKVAETATGELQKQRAYVDEIDAVVKRILERLQ